MDLRQISQNVLNRVHPFMLKVLQEGNVFFDTHCHIFNYRDVPDTFLGVRVPLNERLLSYLEKVLHNVIRRSDTDKYSNLAYFINFLKSKSTDEITLKLFQYYSEKNLIICPLMMDFHPGMGGRIRDDYQTQIEKMKGLRDSFPDKILPFLALDPNNPRMRENFDKVFSEKENYRFFGVKIYPSMGYLPSHPDLMKVYSICQEMNIPVTAHCSGATIHTTKRFIQNIAGVYQKEDGTWSDVPIDKRFRRKIDYTMFFNQPANWNPVLHEFPKLKLNLAHFGGEAAWDLFTSGKAENWVNVIIEMMYRYENLYADFSYTFYKEKNNVALKKLLLEKEHIATRVLYGSDYYMTVTEGHFCALKTAFTSEMGEVLMKKIAMENPMRFLFG